MGRPAIRSCGLLISILVTANWGACMFHFVAFIADDPTNTWLYDTKLMEADNVSRCAQTSLITALRTI